MAARLKGRAVIFDRLIASPAKRARKTALLIAAELGYPKKAISYVPSLYEANTWELLRLVKKTGSRIDTLALVAHNPGLTSFANYVCNAKISSIPTCGIVGIEFSVDLWKKVQRHAGQRVCFDYPKKGML